MNLVLTAYMLFCFFRYHRVNDVQRFRFSRPTPRKDSVVPTTTTGDKDKESTTSSSSNSSNEFASLWLERTVLVTSHPLPGILRWFPVTSSETYPVSPLRNAIETMEATNTALRDLIIAHRLIAASRKGSLLINTINNFQASRLDVF